MGRTFPNLDAVRVTQAGYYFNEKLMKLARLSRGEKLPNHVGPWEYLAPEHALSSSQVVDRLRRERPHLDWRRLTYTVRSPLDRRLPLGVPPQAEHLRFAVVAGLALAAGMVLGRMLPR
jgi:hypothetical protein